MAVYVDGARNGYGRMVMSHMLADTPAELHAMADAIGVSRRWFQPGSSPHDDVCQRKRKAAIDLGAAIFGRREVAALVRKLRASDADWRPQAWPPAGTRQGDGGPPAAGSSSPSSSARTAG